MGCVSSKLSKKEIKREILCNSSSNNGGNYANHVVSLTSSTYGFLNKLENNHQKERPKQAPEEPQEQVAAEKEKCVIGIKRSSPSPPARPLKEDPEVINAWELMGDLDEREDEDEKKLGSKNKCPESMGTGKAVAKTPVKYSLNQAGQGTAPKTRVNKIDGKENINKKSSVAAAAGLSNCRDGQLTDDTPNNKILKLWNYTDNSRKSMSTSRILRKSRGGGSLDFNNNKKSNVVSVIVDGSDPRNSNSGRGGEQGQQRRRRSLTPLFDPDLIQSFEKELSLEQEQIKKMIISHSPTTKKSQSRHSSSSSILLETYQVKCPPGGENSVIIYTTTLRGIRKTFEQCNVVRSILESCQVQFYERDVSMDSGFKEELRKLIGKKEVRVPLCFMKGRLIGGAEEVVRLEEEGKLWGLLEGIEKRDGRSICGGCGGARFVMCMDCNGSCKVLGENGDDTIRCGVCNENGLIRCPICS